MSAVAKKSNFYEKMIQWVKTHSFSKIKANSDGYEKPTAFRKPDDDETFTPDVTAVKLGTKNYFELALKSEDPERTIRKWKLLSTLADMKNGTLYLFAPRGHKAFATKIVEGRNLNAKVISI